jgi:hypothetical protein
MTTRQSCVLFGLVSLLLAFAVATSCTHQGRARLIDFTQLQCVAYAQAKKDPILENMCVAGRPIAEMIEYASTQGQCQVDSGLDSESGH